MKKFLDAGLYANIAKTTFYTTETTFLGYIISTDSVKADPVKVQSILEWKQPRNIKDVQAFLGFMNFYRRFVENCSHKVMPLTTLTKKDTKFEWGNAQEKSFKELKRTFMDVTDRSDPYQAWARTYAG